jgi:hypothetical protein
MADWTKKSPEISGVYWWRLTANDGPADILEVDYEHGFVYDIGDPNGEKLSRYRGEWLGPITPALHANAEKLREALVDAAGAYHMKALHVNTFNKCNVPMCKRVRAVLAESEEK